jgi:hypothetical protein
MCFSSSSRTPLASFNSQEHSGEAKPSRRRLLGDFNDEQVPSLPFNLSSPKLRYPTKK